MMQKRSSQHIDLVGQALSLIRDSVESVLSQVDNLVAFIVKSEPGYLPDSPGCYIVAEEKSERSLKKFLSLTSLGVPGCVFSRRHPRGLRRDFKLAGIPMLWLSRAEAENAIDPNRFLLLKSTLVDFVKRNRTSVILLDGLEYLIMQISFAAVFEYLIDFRNTVLEYNSRIIIPVHKNALSTEERRILQSKFTFL